MEVLMALREKWKEFGKNTGAAFKNLGKALGDTGKVVLGDENKSEDGTRTKTGESWSKVGHSFGEAGKSLGKAAVGTVEKVDEKLSEDDKPRNVKEDDEIIDFTNEE